MRTKLKIAFAALLLVAGSITARLAQAQVSGRCYFYQRYADEDGWMICANTGDSCVACKVKQ